MKCSQCNDMGLKTEVTSGGRCMFGHKDSTKRWKAAIRAGVTPKMCYDLLMTMDKETWRKSDREFVAAYEKALAERGGVDE